MRRVQIRKVARLGTGHTPSRSVEAYWGSAECTIPWLTLADVWQLRDGSVSVMHETKEKISPLGLANSAAVRRPAGTVAFSRTASVGFSCILGVDMATSQDFVTWTCGPKLDPRYLLWVLRAERDDILRRTQGSTHKTIYMPDIEQLTIPLPTLDEQRRIVEYLDGETTRIDDVVSKKRQMKAVLEARRSMATEELVLGLHGGGAAATSFHFSHVPSGWRETILGHLNCRVQTGPFGSQLHASDYVEDGWPVVNPANLRGGVIRPNLSMTISDQKRSELARHVLDPGDIVFGRRGEMGRAGLVTEREAGWLCGTGSLRLRLTDDRLSPTYLKLMLETRSLRDYFELNSIGSTMDNLNSEIVLSMPVLVPPVEVQATIVERCERLASRTRTLVEALERQEALLLEHRRSLIASSVVAPSEAA